MSKLTKYHIILRGIYLAHGNHLFLQFSQFMKGVFMQDAIKVFNFDATDVILQHSLIVRVLRVAKSLQNGKIGMIFNKNGIKNHEK